MTNLKEINFGFNQYCGPAVLSAFTGKSTDECAAVISSISGKREIKAVEVSHLIQALEKLRFDVKREGYTNYSLYMLFINIITKDGLYLILIPHHVIAAEVKDKKIYLIDNHSKQPIEASSSARLTQRVEMVYRVVPKEQPNFLKSEIKLIEFNRNIQIQILNLYKDVEDNTLIVLGQFKYTNLDELKQINMKIAELIHEKQLLLLEKKDGSQTNS